MARGAVKRVSSVNFDVIWRTNEDVRPYAVFARENRCNLLRGAESTPLQFRCVRRGGFPCPPVDFDVIWRTNEDVRPYAVFARENRCNLLWGVEDAAPYEMLFSIKRLKQKIPEK